jgi:Transposase and inactivated derivatives
MAGKRIETMDLRQLVILKKQGFSNRKIAQLLRISRNTVNSYTQIFERSGRTYDQLLALDDMALKELCAPESEVSADRYEDLASQFEYFSTELKKPGCTLLTLWHEYRQKRNHGYGYTQFTHHYNLWVNKLDASGKLNHKAGEKIFIDYTGKKLRIVDRQTGEEKPVEAFVGILPCSQYTYMEASESQQRDELIGSMRRCLEYFGGVTEAIVSDGLKSAVSKACKYEPVINKTFKDFALHYGCVVDPARPYSAQDKALVEGAVKLVYQRIFYPLSKMTFFSIAELNAAIRDLLVKYNNYVFQLTSYSRRELFLSTEKHYLKPLPTTPYELRQYRRAKVQKMGYIFLSEDKHYYSVPYRFIGKHIEVRYTQSVVEIFYNHERLCTHKRDKQPGKYSTQKDHLSSAHKAYSEWSLSFFQRKAENIGPETGTYITRVILQYSYPEIGYKQAMGIIQLTRLYTKERIEKACRRALTLEHCSFRTIDNILRSGSDQLEIPDGSNNHIPEHENIRGSHHYQ